ncbi:MAG: hypothetical protein HOD97_04735 [Candidatus Marinimicrobia bacterium]|jgi:hypothetical protein|nr:hypothetical protein [Candidatus Neomarinimicrobiota bacterium]MBT3618127.1 hypothetical protein [Candidatus Neomarinimicrobiota bacterium]MBT3828598.1 hypothetical protein [Candidatus Neomarinimicrobiota bacterium]MBT3996940.1 hypothetical protein [Candidatus Neomarinimicrobiota bacterium]MBT4280904.1 hypothetical protein [Candidatus Neomarinimicrobiota bacterium]
MKITKQLLISDLLELAIVLLFIFLIIVIYVPRAIWDEEEFYAKESRYRMQNVYDVESFYHILTEDFTEDPLWALTVVNATRDSLTADTTFLENQIIFLDGNEVNVNIPVEFAMEFDTTFGFLKSRRDTVVDTTVTLIMFSEDISRNDTIFVRKNELSLMESNPNFISIVKETPVEHVEMVNYYDSYMPDTSLFFCPVIEKPYTIRIEDNSLRISSPINKIYSEGRYLLFSFKAYNHGYIDDGIPSWD